MVQNHTFHTSLYCSVLQLAATRVFDYIWAEFIIISIFLLSTPLQAESGEPNCSQDEEIRPLKEEKGEDEEETNQEDEKEEKEKDLDSLEWELRNTDSVFSELSELSQEYVESVDHGVGVRGTGGTKQACLVHVFFFLELDFYKKKIMLYICTSHVIIGCGFLFSVWFPSRQHSPV